MPATLRTTIGNIGGPSSLSLPVVLFSAYGMTLSIDKHTASFGVAIIDCLGCIFFWVCIMRWKSFQTRVSVGINENTVTCSGKNSFHCPICEIWNHSL